MRSRLLLLPFFLLIAFSFSACGRHNLNPRGTFANVKLIGQPTVRGELLALTDSTLTIKPAVETPTIEVYRNEDIRYIELEGISNALWRLPLALSAIFPVVSLGTALSAGSNGAEMLPSGLISLAFVVGSWIGFEATEPKTDFKWPLSGEERSQLQLHTRFPYGVTQAQLDLIKTSYGIDDDYH